MKNEKERNSLNAFNVKLLVKINYIFIKCCSVEEELIKRNTFLVCPSLLSLV